MAGRGAKVGIVLVVLLMILGGALFVADRVAANAAEDRIAQETQRELTSRKITTATAPRVDVTGFPFLTQVLDGEYKKITITLEQPDVNGVKLNDLRIEATKVRADARSLMNGTGDVVAGEVVGTATLGWDAVRSLVELAGLPAGVDPSQAEISVVDNKIQVRIPLSINGVNFAIIAKGSMLVEEGKVRVKLEEVGSDQGPAPAPVQNLIRQYRQRLQVTLRLPGLPYSLVVNRVDTSDAGLSVEASATEVSLSA